MVAAGPLHAAPRDAMAFRVAERLAWLSELPFDPSEVRREASQLDRRGVDDAEAVPRLLAIIGFHLDVVVGSRATLAEIASRTRPVLRIDRTSGEYEILIERRGRKVLVISDRSPAGSWQKLQDDDEGASASYIVDLERYPPMPSGTPWKRLLTLLRFEKGDFNVVILYAIAVGILSLATPLGVQALVSTLRLGALIQPLVVLVIAVVLALGLVAIIRTLEVRVVEMMQRRVLVRLAEDLVARIPWASNEVRKRGASSHLNRFFDVFIVHKSLSMLLIDGLDLALAAVLGLIILAFYHPILLAFDLFLIIGFAIVLWLMGRHGVGTSVVESKKKHRLAAWLDQVAEQPSLYRSRNGFEVARDRIDGLTRDYLQHRQDHFAIVLRQTAGGLGLQALASGALLGLGGWLVMQGQLTLGQLVAAEIIVTLVVSSFAKAGKHLESFYDLVAAGDKVAQLLDISEGGGGPSDVYAPADEARGARISFDQVELARGHLTRPVDFAVEAGEAAAVLGRSGSGKSTLAEALVEPELVKSGEIRIDDAPNGSIDASERYDRVEIVRPVRNWYGTIMDHLRTGALFAEHAEVVSLLDDLGLTSRLRALPQGLETPLEADGGPLSETEAILVDLVRAVLRQPDVLVLDGVLDVLSLEDLDTTLDFLRTHCEHATMLALTRSSAVSARFDREFAL